MVLCFFSHYMAFSSTKIFSKLLFNQPFFQDEMSMCFLCVRMCVYICVSLLACLHMYVCENVHV